MTHADLGELGAELRRLAQAVLDGLDPAVRAAAMRVVGDQPGKCQQVWCPVCALIALASGEEHPLLKVVAEHSTTLLAVIRAAVGETGGAPTPPDAPAPPDGPPEGPAGGGRPDTGVTARRSGYQPIPVTVDD